MAGEGEEWSMKMARSYHALSLSLDATDIRANRDNEVVIEARAEVSTGDFAGDELESDEDDLREGKGLESG